MLKVKVDITNRVMAGIEALAKKQVLVGVPASEGGRKDSGPIGNAGLAYIHDNGAPGSNIPPRPFLSPGILAAKPAITAAMKQAAILTMAKGPVEFEKGLNRAGLIAVASVKNRIVSQAGFEPLKPATLKARARAGFEGTKALIRTGQLVGSINYVVRKVG